MDTLQPTEREVRQFWAVTDAHEVKLVTGHDCAPTNPNYWWVPELGYSMYFGPDDSGSLFTNKPDAIHRAMTLIQVQQSRLNRQMNRLLDELKAANHEGGN